MTDPILIVNDLKKHFVIGHRGLIKREPITVKAIDGINFDVREAETFGLVGESGSGKSTVAYITVGMVEPTSGTIRFRGQDLFGNGQRPHALKKAIQIVYQDPGSSLNPRRTIQQILELPLRIHRPHQDHIREILHLLEMVELPPDYMYKYPHMLSGGEKQIVAIARALATDPALIILDEPTSALDVSVQGKIINLLMRLQREFNLSYLFITHDLSLMRNVASRVAIMYLGKIAEVAETAEFFENPQCRRSRCCPRKRKRSNRPRSSPPARYPARSTSRPAAVFTCAAPALWTSAATLTRSWSNPTPATWPAVTCSSSRRTSSTNINKKPPHRFRAVSQNKTRTT
jgi:peptide/nickel transport system ATP-binding protein